MPIKTLIERRIENMPTPPGVERAPVLDKLSGVIPKFKYETVSIKDIECRGRYDENGHFHTDMVEVKGARVLPSGRFWNSVCSLYGIGPSVFKYFTPEETFLRISEKAKEDKVKLAIEMNGQPDECKDGQPVNMCLAVSNPNKTIIHDDEAQRAFQRLRTKDLKYGEGKFFSRVGLKRDIQFTIGQDLHDGYITCECPIDGYGRPQLFVSLLRTVCVNGMVGYAKAFKTEMILGDEPERTMIRNIEAYSNEDGFCCLRDRLLAAQKSMASVFETALIGKAIWKLKEEDFTESFRNAVGDGGTDKHFLRNRLLETLSRKTGDLRAIYGVAQIDSISEKRMRQLPTKATVYDLICLATELGSHQLKPLPARQVLVAAGQSVGQEYDLEGSSNVFPEFDSFIDPESRKAMEANNAIRNLGLN